MYGDVPARPDATSAAVAAAGEYSEIYRGRAIASAADGGTLSGAGPELERVTLRTSNKTSFKPSPNPSQREGKSRFLPHWGRLGGGFVRRSKQLKLRSRGEDVIPSAA